MCQTKENKLQPRAGNRVRVPLDSDERRLTGLVGPFVTGDGVADVLFALPSGQYDLDVYARSTEAGKNLKLQPGLRGDIDYAISLAAELGALTKWTAKDRTALLNVRAKQCFLISDEERARSNMISVGSGAVNTITRWVLEQYGTSLPATFEFPISDTAIVCNLGGKQVLRRRSSEHKHAGLLLLVPNPANPEHRIAVAAGMRVTGTQAALIALADLFSGRADPVAKMTFDKELGVWYGLVEARDIVTTGEIETATSYCFLTIERVKTEVVCQEEARAHSVDSTKIANLLAAIDKAHAPTEKGAKLEELAKYLFESIEGLTVVAQDITTGVGEIDLMVKNASFDPFLGKLGPLFLVECKNWAERVGEREIGWFKDVLDARGIKHGFLFAPNGVTGTKDSAGMGYISRIRREAVIMVVTREHLNRIAQGENPVQVLQDTFIETMKL